MLRAIKMFAFKYFSPCLNVIYNIEIQAQQQIFYAG